MSPEAARNVERDEEPRRKDGHVLAHVRVRSLLETQGRDVLEAAARVARSAGDGGPDADAIHDYRVALRRLRTSLAAASPLFEKKPLARVRDGLRRLAREAGAVRDEEVLVETLAGFDLPAATRARVGAWLLERARRERRLRAAVVAELARRASDPAAPSDPGAAPDAPALPVLLSLVEALPLRRKASAVSTRALARDALREAAREVLEEAARPDAESPRARHRLRIRWKRVRYIAEIFSEALPGEALEDLVKAAAHMQKRLGAIHDLDEAIARVARARALSLGDRMVVHHRLRTARAELAERLAEELPAALSILPSQDERS